MKSGSLDNLKDSTRCGWSPKARQMRLTADWLMPVASAIDRVDQCVASAGALLERLDDHRFDAVAADASWHPGSHLVKESIETITRKASSPLADRDRMNPQCRGDLAIRRARRDAKDDARAQRERLGGLSSSCQRLEFVALVLRQHDLSRRTTSPRTLFLHGSDHSESLS